jgi:hypothetical protein
VPVLVPDVDEVDEGSLSVDVFDVEWLEELLDVPADAVWPRLMSAPHRDAVGSYEPQFTAWCRSEHGMVLRWFQRLSAARLLEHDVHGALCWEVVLLSVARQVGKTRLSGLLLDWRSESAGLFGEPQLIMHTANVLSLAEESLDWATPRAESKGWHRRYAAGDIEIDKSPLGRWLIRSQRSTVGYTVSMGYVDEAWSIGLATVQQNMAPTTVEAKSGQLLLASTADPRCTELVPTYRAEALDQLGDGDGTLLLEWSAAAGSVLGSMDAARAASPHWSRRRERVIAADVKRALPYLDAGPGVHELVAGVRCQWFNIWPRHGGVEGRGEPLLPDRAWAARVAAIPAGDFPAVVALVDNNGHGAAVAVVLPHVELGLLEVGGWCFESWDDAWSRAAIVAEKHRRSLVVVGDEMTPDAARFGRGTRFVAPALKATKIGLALLRSHVATGRVVHDRDTADLDAQIGTARVVPTDAGLSLVRAQGRRTDLLRGVCWCLVEAERPRPTPAVH